MGETCGVEISRETFTTLPQAGRDGVLYDYLDVIYKKVQKLESQKRVDTKKAYAVAGVAGLVGGIISNVFRKLFLP